MKYNRTTYRSEVCFTHWCRIRTPPFINPDQFEGDSDKECWIMVANNECTHIHTLHVDRPYAKHAQTKLFLQLASLSP